MAVRQYIGARYVPRFSDVNNGIWSNVYQYDPLTIVKHGNDYYTSKQTVPVGTPITDTDYWVMTGNYNGAIESLQDQINNMQDIDGSLQDQINNIKDQLNIGDNKKIIAISDSYGMSDGAGGWLSKFKKIVESYTNFNWSVIYSGVSGTGFVGNDGTFLSQFNSIASGLTDDQKNAITDIIVGGGWNDIGKSNIVNAINTFISSVNNICPNARIHIGFIGFDTHQSIIEHPVITQYQAACAVYGASYIPNSEFIAHNINNMTDTRHPNDTGYTRIAQFMAEYMVSGYATVYFENVPMNVTPSVTGFAVTTAYQYMLNGVVNTFIGFAQTINVSGLSMTFDGSTWYTLADVKGLLGGNALGTDGTVVNLTALVTDSETSTDIIVYTGARLAIMDNKLKICPLYGITNGGKALNTSKAHVVKKLYLPRVVSFTSICIIK